MADWIGTARSNYVKIADLEGLQAALVNFGIEIGKHDEHDTYCLLAVGDGDGGWPSFSYDEDDNEIEFSFESLVMPFVAEGEVLVVMEAGAERLRYVSGHASAYIRRGDQVSSTSLSLNDIYDKACREFGVPAVNPATY